MIIVFSIAICDDEPVICAGIRHILNRHKEAVKSMSVNFIQEKRFVNVFEAAYLTD